jgi:hypothetical protein
MHDVATVIELFHADHAAGLQHSISFPKTSHWLLQVSEDG